MKIDRMTENQLEAVAQLEQRSFRIRGRLTALKKN